MMEWSKAYGPDADAFAVRPGDVWQVGPHRVACLDLEDEPRAAAWMHWVEREAPPRGVCFVDPPWGANLARGYRTKAGLDGAKGRPVDYPALLRRIIAAMGWAAPTRPAWVEIGGAQAGLALELLAEVGWPVRDSWPAVYANNKPCTIIRAATHGAPLGIAGPAGQRDDFLPAFAIARDSAPGECVYDPCTGRGLTAVSAAGAGRVFYGSELNPRRVSVTLAKLARLTGHAPQLAGRLP